MIALGLRLDWLGSEALSWRDLLVIIRQSPADSAVVRAMDPDSHWGLSEHLLAQVVDNTSWLVWAKTEDGSKNRNRPQPWPRPGVEPDEGKSVKGTPIPLDEAARRLGWSMEGVG